MTTMTLHFISIRVAMVKSTTPNVEDVGRWKFSNTASYHKLVQPLWRTILYKVDNGHTYRAQQFYCQVYIPEEVWYPIHKNPYMRMLWAELCIGETEISFKSLNKRINRKFGTLIQRNIHSG